MPAQPAAGRADRRDRDARIHGDDPILIGEDRIEIELADLRHVGRELRNLDHEQRHAILVGGRDIAIGLELAGYAGARDECARQVDVERRQGQGLVVDHFYRRSAAAENNDRPERRIVRKPDDELACLRANHHGINGHAGKSCIRPGRMRAGENVGHGFAHRPFAGEVEAHASHFRLVDDVWRENFGDNGRSPCEKRRRSRSGFVGVARERHGHNGNGVAREQPGDLHGIEPAAAIRDGAPDDRTGCDDIRRKILRQARRRRHQHVDRFLVAHEMHEAAHRIGFGRVLGNACPLERIGLRPGPAEPNRQDGFRLESAGAMRLHRRDNGLCRLGCGGERGWDIHRQDGVVAGIAE